MIFFPVQVGRWWATERKDSVMPALPEIINEFLSRALLWKECRKDSCVRFSTSNESYLLKSLFRNWFLISFSLSRSILIIYIHIQQSESTNREMNNHTNAYAITFVGNIYRLFWDTEVRLHVWSFEGSSHIHVGFLLGFLVPLHLPKHASGWTGYAK